MRRTRILLLSCAAACATLGLSGRSVAEPAAPTASIAARSDLPNDWPAIPHAAPGAPNILLVLTDDVGFGAASTFGGPVPTLNLDRLAGSGLVYNRFHTTAMCSPTRAALLTGRNHHAVATGALTDFAIGAPGYNGRIPASAATIGRLLRDSGYSTAFIGKHHNVPDGPFGSAGPFDYWPTNMGFEHFFGFAGSDTDQFRPTLYRGTERIVDKAQDPEMLDARLADDAIAWLHQRKGAAPDKPFFLYYAPASAHMPHQAPQEWLNRFRGKFAQGWEAQRQATLARQKAAGLVPRNVKLPAWPADLPTWSSLSPDERAVQERMMEAFAAELAYQDNQFGRLLDELDRMGLRDNTLIVFIEGDNGPDSAGSPDGSFAEAGELANRKLTQQEHHALIDRIGGPLVHSNYSSAWAQAMSTPFPYYKQIASHLGGTRNGMVISWPQRIKERGLRTQYGHVIDIAPTLMTAAGIAPPAQVDGVPQQPIDGIDLTYSFTAPKAPSRRTVQYYEMTGNRAIYADGWLASTVPLRAPWHASWMDGWSAANHAADYRWQLFNLDKDFNQTTDLSLKMPAKLEEMRTLFESQAQKYAVNPVIDAPRYRLSNAAYTLPRDRFDFWGKGVSLLTNEAPPFLGRAFTLTADISGGNGVLMALGSSMGGWAFFLKDGKPAVHLSISPMPQDQLELVAPDAIPAGRKALVTYDFDYDGGGFGKGGEIVIKIDGRPVARKRFEQSIMAIEGNNENFDVGFDGGVPVVEEMGMDNGFSGDLNRLTLQIGPIGKKRPPAR